jgi:hypothetical protein
MRKGLATKQRQCSRYMRRLESGLPALNSSNMFATGLTSAGHNIVTGMSLTTHVVEWAALSLHHHAGVPSCCCAVLKGVQQRHNVGVAASKRVQRSLASACSVAHGISRLHHLQGSWLYLECLLLSGVSFGVHRISRVEQLGQASMVQPSALLGTLTARQLPTGRSIQSTLHK